MYIYKEQDDSWSDALRVAARHGEAVMIEVIDGTRVAQWFASTLIRTGVDPRSLIGHDRALMLREDFLKLDFEDDRIFPGLDVVWVLRDVAQDMPDPPEIIWYAAFDRHAAYEPSPSTNKKDYTDKITWGAIEGWMRTYNVICGVATGEYAIVVALSPIEGLGPWNQLT